MLFRVGRWPALLLGALLFWWGALAPAMAASPRMVSAAVENLRLRSGPGPRDLSFVLIPRNAPGVSMTATPTMGIKGVPTNERLPPFGTSQFVSASVSFPKCG